ncbi:MAG: Biotin carboxylase-like protein, partial [Candidatus Berkelbacteria bacterium Licking1014_96]
DFSAKVQKQAQEIAQKLGSHLKGSYRRILGIDFVLDEKKEELYPIECNPRLLGSFPVFSMIQEREKEPQILYFHFLANLFPEIKVEVDKINQQMAKNKKGGQIILNNRFERELIIKKSLQAGVYNFAKNKLNYLRPGYLMSDLKNKNEFILTDGLLSAGVVIKEYRKICRLLTLAKILDSDKIKLNPSTCAILDKIYQRVEEGK